MIDDRIREALGGYDIYVGLIWLRMGTPTGDWRSGTEAELRYALDAYKNTGRPELLFYVKNARKGQERQPGVDDLIRELRGGGLPQNFRSKSDLRPMLLEHLAEKIRRLEPAGLDSVQGRLRRFPLSCSAAVLTLYSTVRDWGL